MLMGDNYWETKNNKWEDQVAEQTGVGASSSLQQFLVQTYTWMTLGLAITGVLAVLTVSNETMTRFVFGNPFVFYGLIIAELGMVIAFSIALRKGASASNLLIMFLTYSALNGVTLSAILLMYTAQSVATTFFITAGTFGGMSVYGYVTKRDLTGIGNFMRMGLLGLIIVMVVNMFLGSSILSYGISLIGVAIFTILTAYDTQKLKAYHAQYAGDEQGLKRLSLGGALSLYLDFINLFLFLLRLLGGRR